MTVGLDEATETTEADESAVGAPLAGWWQRAEAFAIDVLCPFAVAAVVFLALGAAFGWPLLWVLLLTALVVAVFRLVIPAVTGSSFGRSVVGIKIVDRDGGAVGPARLAARELAHLLDTLPFCLGWLWPLLDLRRRTFADRIARTEVVQESGDRPDRRTLAARVLGVAAALSLLVGILGYALVYRNQQALDRARDAIAQDGPQLVTDMLSYTVKTADDDFARAQTLVTEGYRPELIKQQEAVKKNGLVDNTYWASNSAVLSSDRDRAAMLLLLQGQRGAGATQRFVTASVRAEYEKFGDKWLVSNLTVLAAPKPAPAPAPPDKPAGQKPADPDKPTAAPKPSADKPAPPKPPADKPAAPKPSADKPAAPKPSADKPAAPMPSEGAR